MQWVLDSCQLGLVPSSDILRKLLLSNQKQEEIYQPVVDLSGQKISAHESESYWDESPATNEDKMESYWDERPVNKDDAKEGNYWDESSDAPKANSYWDEAPAEAKKVEETKFIPNDNDRAFVAAY